jgi:hypothetical protein
VEMASDVWRVASKDPCFSLLAFLLGGSALRTGLKTGHYTHTATTRLAVKKTRH